MSFTRFRMVIALILCSMMFLYCKGCLPDEFQCIDAQCIPYDYVCDSYGDCSQNEDESLCGYSEPEPIYIGFRSCIMSPSCEEGDFYCDDGLCVAEDFRCDGFQDCLFWEDEIDCADELGCDDGEFRCSDGICISEEYVCDNYQDCAFSEDERFCEFCPEDYFLCLDDTCIHSDHVCDYFQDCYNFEDEDQCYDVECGNDTFGCLDGRCIAGKLRCNFEPDCLDGSDEIGCSAELKYECTYDAHICGDGTCIHLNYVCDHLQHCEDSSDEANCTEANVCPEDYFACWEDSCIESHRVCDYWFDCPYGEDEDRCDDVRCSNETFQCLNGKCIPEKLRCNVAADCLDGSDEIGCAEESLCITNDVPPAWEDIRISNRIDCDSCIFNCGRIRDFYVDQFTCACDGLCLLYGDCCVDFQETCSEQYSIGKDLLRKYNFTSQQSTCIVSQRKFILRGSAVMGHCEANTSACDIENAQFTIPVTDLDTNVAFINYECAKCNNVVNVYRWPAALYCNDFLELYKRANGSYLEIRLDDIESYLDIPGCVIYVSYPDNLPLHDCVFGELQYYFDSCPEACGNEELVRLCEKTGPQMVYITDITVKYYKNIYCALCNGRILSYGAAFSCGYEPGLNFAYAPLFKFPISYESETEVYVCEDDLFDDVAKDCAHVHKLCVQNSLMLISYILLIAFAS